MLYPVYYHKRYHASELMSIGCVVYVERNCRCHLDSFKRHIVN